MMVDRVREIPSSPIARGVVIYPHSPARAQCPAVPIPHLSVYMHAVLVFELQLVIYILVRTVVVDKNFRLFEVGSGGKRGAAVFWFPNDMPNGVFDWTVELSGRDNAG